MALQIITADQRRMQQTVCGLISGQPGVGKTTLLKTLPPESTLALDYEGGMLSAQTNNEFGPPWAGDSVRVESWPESKAILEAFQQKAPFLANYNKVFIDSLTFTSRQCAKWCKEQPQCRTKDGSIDQWAIFRLLSTEMTDWVTGWKNLFGVSSWMLCGLERKKVENVTDWMPLLDGLKLHQELPYIFDFSFVMARFRAADGNTYTGLFTDPVANPEYAHVPVKRRVTLDPIEQPHLGRLTEKAIGLLKTNAPPPSTVPAGHGGDATSTLNHESEAA